MGHSGCSAHARDYARTISVGHRSPYAEREERLRASWAFKVVGKSERLRKLAYSAQDTNLGFPTSDRMTKRRRAIATYPQSCCCCRTTRRAGVWTPTYDCWMAERVAVGREPSDFAATRRLHVTRYGGGLSYRPKRPQGHGVAQPSLLRPGRSCWSVTMGVLRDLAATRPFALFAGVRDLAWRPNSETASAV